MSNDVHQRKLLPSTLLCNDDDYQVSWYVCLELAIKCEKHMLVGEYAISSWNNNRVNIKKFIPWQMSFSNHFTPILEELPQIIWILDSHVNPKTIYIYVHTLGIDS